MVNPDAFEIVLEYLYTKEFHVVGNAWDLLIDIFELASQYNLEVLKHKLEYTLALNITEETVCSLMIFADAHMAVDVRLNHNFFIVVYFFP